MSQGLRESLLSYQFSKTERALAASSSTDSQPSPGESIRSRSPQTLNRARPRLSIRPHSSGGRGEERIRIQIIEESHDASSPQPVEQATTAFRRASENIDGQILVDTFPLLRQPSDRKDRDSSPQYVPPGPPATPAEPLSGKRKTSRPAWVRTRSGGVWYLKQRDTSSQDDGSTRSVKSVNSRSSQNGLTSISIVPLKPPPRPRVLQTSPTNHIVVERPFGHDQDAKISSRSSLKARSTGGDRRSSVDVKRIFSTPFAILRRSRIDKLSQAPSPSPAQTQSSTNLANVTGHNSPSARNGIAANLQRVSSLLEDYVRPKFTSHLRSYSHKTKSSTGSSDQDDSRNSRTKALIGTFQIPRKRSTDHLADHASSILNIHMGSTPQNSPTEKATYKVKRRPSAATEEFIKIDISIRGSTSYLPSEARRISTPPLPHDNQHGVRRGFFFDHNAPKSDDICDEADSAPQRMRLEGFDYINHHSSTNPGVTRPATSTNFGRSPSKKAAFRTKTGDWYDTQLADLDVTADMDVTGPAEPERLHQCKNECQSRLAEIKRQRYEAQLDHSIPEHLPNSPLCPRNPRYWRVKQNKGSQFRGCWMHGFGEYNVVPGLYK